MCSIIEHGHMSPNIGVVRRYGAAAAGVQAMIDAAADGPTIAQADIDFACGNCKR